MTRPLGVILAGGQARRMGGGDKGLLDLGGQTILSHVVNRLRPQVADLALNANGDPERFAAYDLPVLQDRIEGFAGPLAGVLAGLDWAAAQGADVIVTAAADTPFFPHDLVDRLQAEAQGMRHPLVLAATRDGAQNTRGGAATEPRVNRHPTFGLWPVALREDLRSALEDGLRKVVLWTDRHNGRQTIFPTDGTDPFFNVNTPEDLALANAQMEAKA